VLDAVGCRVGEVVVDRAVGGATDGVCRVMDGDTGTLGLGERKCQTVKPTPTKTHKQTSTATITAAGEVDRGGVAGGP